MNRKKVAILFSGGVESSSLIAIYLKKNIEVYPIFVEFGFDYEKVEKEWAKRIVTWFKRTYKNLRPIHYIKVPDFPKRSIRKSRSNIDIIIPLRNMILMGHSAIYLKTIGIHEIVHGTLGCKDFPDNDTSYFKELEKLISKGLMDDFKISTPFLGKKKEMIIQKNYRIVPFALTYSCVKAIKGEHCGRCVKCTERIKSFEKLNIVDQTFYVKKIIRGA